MLSKVRVVNFQSLTDVEIVLGKLTVIVGASSSGKSAFLRAARTLAQNAGSPSFVTRGQKTASITGVFDGNLVNLERGPSTSLYRTVVGDEEKSYPKSGVSVPEEVAKIINAATLDGRTLSFTTQFDAPFLLDESGGTIARSLGELTNINVIYEASREANRRRLECGSKAKAATEAVGRAQEKLDELQDAHAEAERLVEAREALESAKDTQSKVSRLTDALSRLQMAAGALSKLKAESVTVPDIAQVEKTAGLINRLDLLSTYWQALETRLAQEHAEALALDETLARSRDEYDEVLRSSGTCPICGQQTAALTSMLS